MQYIFSLMELALNCLPSFLECFDFFSWYQFYLVIMGKQGLIENKIRCCLGDMDMEQKSENHKTFKGLSIEFLSTTCHF